MILITVTVLETDKKDGLNIKTIISEVTPVSTRERLAGSLMKVATDKALSTLSDLAEVDGLLAVAKECAHDWTLCAHTEPEWRPVYKCNKCGLVRAA